MRLIKKINCISLLFLLIMITPMLINCNLEDDKKEQDEKIKYNLAIEENDKGTVEVSSDKAYFKDIVTINVFANEGYIVDGIYVNNKIIEGNTFQMPEADVTIKVNYKEKESTENGKVIKDINYKGLGRLKYDLYLPKNYDTINKPVGLLVLLHGGYWIAGNKELFTTHCDEVMNRMSNLIVANMNYSYISNSINLSNVLDDITVAIANMKTQLSYYNIELSGVALAGHSAGGHLALMYSYTRFDESPVPVKFCVSAAGPADFDKLKDSYEYNTVTDNIFMNLAGMDDIEKVLNNLDNVSPISYVENSKIPTIIMQGAKDTLVLPINAESLKNKLDEYNVMNTYIEFPNCGHMFDNDKDILLMEKTLEEITKYANNFFNID